MDDEVYGFHAWHPSPPQCLTSFSSLFLINHTKCVFFNIFGFETKIHISRVCKKPKTRFPFYLQSITDCKLPNPLTNVNIYSWAASAKNLSSSFKNDLTRRVERFSPGRAGHILGIFLQKTNGTNNVLKIHFSHCKLDGCYRSNLFLKSLLIEVASHVIGENIGLRALGVDKVFKIANSLS